MKKNVIKNGKIIENIEKCIQHMTQSQSVYTRGQFLSRSSKTNEIGESGLKMLNRSCPKMNCILPSRVCLSCQRRARRQNVDTHCFGYLRFLAESKGVAERIRHKTGSLFFSHCLAIPSIYER